MIKEFKPCAEPRESAIFYYSVYEQILEYFENFGPEAAGEFAITALELGFTGNMSTDDKHIQIALKNFEAMSKRNKEKYENKISAKRENEIEEKGYRIIVEMMGQGKTQQEIAAVLGVSRQTVNNRVAKIRSNFPELLAGCQSDVKGVKDVKDVKVDSLDFLDNVKSVKDVKDVKVDTLDSVKDVKENCQTFDNVSKNFLTMSKESKGVKPNDNDNVNDNVNDNESGTALSICQGGREYLAEQQPCSGPFSPFLELPDWRVMSGALCEKLPDSQKALLREALSRLPNTSPCWIYCALKKLNFTNDITDKVYRLRLPDFQKEVDTLVDVEIEKLRAQNQHLIEIAESMVDQPPAKLISIPRPAPRPRQVYNIEDY